MEGFNIINSILVTGVVLANASMDIALHDTYYVVAHWDNNIICSLLPIATLPAGAVKFYNLAESEGKIRTSFSNQRGVYLWTNKLNDNQYVGSATNLSTRLSSYFTQSYLKSQTDRGSAISLAIMKYGYNNFSLQVLVLGPSILRENISLNSDHILLEQYYLNAYELKYNIRRIALGPAPVSNSDGSNLIGENNPQFGKMGSDSAAWSHRHSAEQKALWSLTRSTPIFIYNASDISFNKIIYGYERLAEFLAVHVNTARRSAKSNSIYTNINGDSFIISLVELSEDALQEIKANSKARSTVSKVVHVYNKDRTILLKTFPTVNEFIKLSKQNGSSVKLLCESDKLWLDEYFLSYELIPGADNSLSNVSDFNPILRSPNVSIPVYTYSADGKTFIKSYSSLRACVKALEGNRNFNTKTLELCIKHQELYHGFIVSTIPLFDHPPNKAIAKTNLEVAKINISA